MKKVYLVKKNREMPAAEDNWIVMDGREFAAFMQTPEGKTRSPGFGKLAGCGPDDVILIVECGEENARQWQSERNRNAYAARVCGERGYTFVPIQSIPADVPGGMPGEALLPDGVRGIEEAVTDRMMSGCLHAAVRTLTPEEQDLVDKLFLAENPMTEKEYAESIGSTRDSVHERKRSVLKRLRALLGSG